MHKYRLPTEICGPAVSPISSMRCCVTGGAGFFGSTREALAARGDRVTAVDDLSIGRLENLDAEVLFDVRNSVASSTAPIRSPQMGESPPTCSFTSWEK